jgi:serine/threonine-protein kinase
VLFFQNLGSPDDEYFADGITDAITARLIGIRGLGIISRQSTIQYKDSDKSLRVIGAELGVDYILEGTIQRERPTDPTSRVRIIPQFIRVSDDIHLWADTYDEDMTEVFRVQSDIAERVANALDVVLLESEREALNAIPTENIEAYEYYLRGNELFGRRYSSAVTGMAIQMYEKATKLDPGFAAAWAKLSQAYIWGFYSQYSQTPDWKTAAKAAVDKAHELAPGSADVEMAFAHYYYYSAHEFARALEHLERARSSRPNDVDVLNTIAFIKRRLGDWDEVVVLLEKSLDLNPRYHVSAMELGITYVTMRQYDKAERIIDRAIVLEPHAENPHVFKIMLYLLRDGDREKANKALMEASEFVNPAKLGFELHGFSHSRIMPDTYAELMERIPADASDARDTTLLYLGLAEMYHQLGQEEQARHYWEKIQVHLEPVRHILFQYDVELCRGLAHAGLGKSEEAIRLARDALAKAPMSSDAFLGTVRIHMAALIFVRTGMYEEAIDQLEFMLSVPSEMSPALLRIDPAWDPLRNHPRFQKLVEGEP